MNSRLFVALVLLGLIPSTCVYGDEAATSQVEVEEVDPGHSLHGAVFNEGPRQQAYLMEGMGNIDFPVTTSSPQAQQFINQGIAQIHGFWFFEAERSFRQAALLDPDCAMAYWGMAMSNMMNIPRMKGFTEEAVKRRAQASKREQFYIDSLTTRSALYELLREYPDEIEAHAFLGIFPYVQSQRDHKPMRDVEQASRHLEEVLRRNPMHPCHHYFIHLWDERDPERALDSAAKCGQSAPGIAHMWHMSGHLYSHLNRQQEAVRYMNASIRVDHRHLLHDQIIPDQIAFYTHNSEWLVRALSAAGRVDEAIARAKDLIELPRHPELNYFTAQDSSTYGRDNIFDVLVQYERWDDIVELCESGYIDKTDRPRQRVQWSEYLGIAYARLGQVDKAEAVQREMEEHLGSQDESAKWRLDKNEGRIELARNRLAANIALANGSALWSEMTVPTLGLIALGFVIPIGVVVAVRKKWLTVLVGVVLAFAGWQVGSWLLQPATATEFVGPELRTRDLLDMRRIEEAVVVAEERAEEHHGEVPALSDLILALWSADRRDEAKQYFEELREVATYAELDSPPMQRLAPIAKALGYPEDWRAESDVVAKHPELSDLDSFGPIQWQNWRAPTWTLNNGSGEERSLEDWRGEPTVLIFYLGSGCLHCVEQIQAFAQQRNQLEAAGLKVVAVSTETEEELKAAMEKWGQEFPFELVSDAQNEVFQAYRCYDEFENMPLHGTFLIDADGFVRWQDIGAEPFSNAEFFITEAQRLLQFSAHTLESTKHARTENALVE